MYRCPDQGCRQKTFLTLDKFHVHHCKPVKVQAAECTDKIEQLPYLPSYSPELNPEEWLNADMKQAIGSKASERMM